jgi:hypothetical protein
MTKCEQPTTVPVALGLRANEWVEVRSAQEILSTLDDRQSMDGLPFMPEMLQYCGKRFRVFKTAHKTCDTVKNYAIRRMVDTVHLDGLRCDGTAHAGCQASCTLFWKEAWLKRADPPPAALHSAPTPDHTQAWATLLDGTRVKTGGGPARYRCQATDLREFSAEVRRRGRWNPSLYLKDLTSGNVTIGHFIRYGLLAMLNAVTERWLGRRYPHLRGLAQGRTPVANLDIKPGEIVQVLSRDEIMQTLGPNMKNRGLHFDVEMVRFCGEKFRVLKKVDRIVDEKTGNLLEFTNPCLILDGATCSGTLSSCRMFCPRELYPFWHEAWLKRADTHAPAAAVTGEHGR